HPGPRDYRRARRRPRRRPPLPPVLVRCRRAAAQGPESEAMSSSVPLAPVIDHLPAGIVHVALPTPFPVGPVNCYVLLDDPVTVVDPGMLWADSTELLEAALAAHGRTLADVAQVLITHGHPDHFG